MPDAELAVMFKLKVRTVKDLLKAQLKKAHHRRTCKELQILEVLHTLELKTNLNKKNQN